MFRQMTILAPGLLGASLGMAAHRFGLADRIVVWARRAESRVEAESQGWCDATAAKPEEAVNGADFVVLCPPVDIVAPLCEQIADHLATNAIVTDVGSTKSLISRHCTAALRGTTATFVGSHPMAGSERTGMAHATPDLFRGRTGFVTPLVDTPEDAVEQVVRFWKALEMEVTSATPETHDEIVAHISHLPHILASVLCALLARQETTWRNYAGNGLRDTTRIASGSPAIWKAIIQQNREEILRALTDFDIEMQRIRSAVANNQPFEILNVLERGKAFRDDLRPGE